MIKLQHLLLLILLAFCSCKQSKKDTSHQDIYEFMKVVIKLEKLNQNYGLRINPESRFNTSESDSITFNNLLFEIDYKKQKIDSLSNDIYTFQITPLFFLSGFTKEDIAEMKNQKKNIKYFQWDNSRLGFNATNNENFYSFSIPLFSKDKNKAVMMIKNLCQGLCGSGKTIIFTKNNNKWTSSYGRIWYH